MKTIGYLTFTLLMSGSALYEAFRLKENISCFLLAAGIWILYFWAMNRRIRKTAARRMGERMFEEHMRSSYEQRIRF